MGEPTRVVIVGAGFGGLGAARAVLDRLGERAEVTILERADDVGGVWRENTYPGAACDVPSPLYSWSWAPNPHWRRRYAEQPQILDYIRDVAERTRLRGLVRTGQDVGSVRWQPATRTWLVATAAGQEHEAEIVVLATGQLSDPVVPRLPGVDEFTGPAFHSARWRHDVDLTGRKVAVVGTGASAIQFVPAIVDRVGSMTVFQRTAPYVVPKPDRAYPSLHHRVFERWPATLRGERRATFALTESFNRALEGTSLVTRPYLAAARAAWRLHLRRGVSDPALRRLLHPDYPIGCKRLLFSNDWYPALDREHVEVVTSAVERVEAGGVRAADGSFHPADVLIWGTGFSATDFLAGVEVQGPDGVGLDEVWGEGAVAHLGLGVAGFPNLFFMFGPNTNLGGSSIIAMIEAQAGWVSQVAEGVAAGRARAVAPRRRVYEEWDAEMRRRLSSSVWVHCTSWYREGPAGRITTNWPGTVTEYAERTARVRWDELEEVG